MQEHITFSSPEWVGNKPAWGEQAPSAEAPDTCCTQA